VINGEDDMEQHQQEHEPDKRPRKNGEEKALTPQVIREIIREPGHAIAVDADPVALMEQRARSIGRMRALAIACTLPEHWSDHDGKPYLSSAGAQCAARLCGVKVTSTRDRREEHRDQDGAYYEYVYTATVSLPGDIDSIDGVVGSCTSRDPIVGTGDGKRAIEDVDPGDIRKKAQTNMLQRGITQLLGLREISWATLGQFGITPNGAKVEYKTGAKGGGHQGEEYSFKFGRGKDTPISKLSEEDLGWYLKAAKESLADPKKEKYKRNSQEQIDVIEKELARRKNGAEGATAPAEQPSIWKRLTVLGEQLGFPSEEEIKPIIKKATSKTSAAALTEEDFKKAAGALQEAARSMKSDVNF
jgi:hypothetical protein